MTPLEASESIKAAIAEARKIREARLLDGFLTPFLERSRNESMFAVSGIVFEEIARLTGMAFAGDPWSALAVMQEALADLLGSAVTEHDSCAICREDMTRHASGCSFVAAEQALVRAAEAMKGER